MVVNNYILYKKNYRRPGKLKSRYNYIVSIIESLGEEWLMLKDKLEQMILGDHEDSENFLKRKSPNALSAEQREEEESQNSMKQMEPGSPWRMLP
jgi:hypothetical protein